VRVVISARIQIVGDRTIIERIVRGEKFNRDAVIIVSFSVVDARGIERVYTAEFNLNGRPSGPVASTEILEKCRLPLRPCRNQKNRSPVAPHVMDGDAGRAEVARAPQIKTSVCDPVMTKLL